MVYDYLISLKKPNFKPVDIISQLLYVIAAATFVYMGLRLGNWLNVYTIAAAMLVAVYVLVKMRTPKNGMVYYTPGYAIAAITFAAGPFTNWVLFSFYLLCLFLEREFKFNKEVGFSEREVVFNTLIKKRHAWSEFSNVVIKDGIITFDFKNNQVLQKEIEGDVPPTMETEFNDYCRRQMEVVVQP